MDRGLGRECLPRESYEDAGDAPARLGAPPTVSYRTEITVAEKEGSITNGNIKATLSFRGKIII